jgi:hypothetical protein
MNREGVKVRNQGHIRCGKEYGIYGYPGDYLPGDGCGVGKSSLGTRF